MADSVTPDDLPDGLLSVVVFGPGHGEAILMRFPDGSLGIVDGCGAEPKNPVLRLARGLRAKGAAPLKFAALTHPHTDHLLGLTEVIDELEPQEIWFAGAEHPRMFEPLWLNLRKLEGAASVDSDPEGRPAHVQLKELIEHIVSYADGSRCIPHQLGHRQQVLRFDVGGIELSISSLLPTTVSNLRAVAQAGSDIASRLVPDIAEDVETLDREVNDLSAVLLVQWGAARVLLGGDAEIGGPGRGWIAAEVEPPIHLLKVPHHASSGAFHRPLWERLRPVIAVVTPFQHGTGRQPPQRLGLDQFAECCETLVLTSPPECVEPRVRGVIRGLGRARPSPRPEVTNAVVVRLSARGLEGMSLHGRAATYLKSSHPPK